MRLHDNLSINKTPAIQIDPPEMISYEGIFCTESII